MQVATLCHAIGAPADPDHLVTNSTDYNDYVFAGIVCVVCVTSYYLQCHHTAVLPTEQISTVLCGCDARPTVITEEYRTQARDHVCIVVMSQVIGYLEGWHIAWHVDAVLLFSLFIPLLVFLSYMLTTGLQRLELHGLRGIFRSADDVVKETNVSPTTRPVTGTPASTVRDTHDFAYSLVFCTVAVLSWIGVVFMVIQVCKLLMLMTIRT